RRGRVRPVAGAIWAARESRRRRGVLVRVRVDLCARAVVQDDLVALAEAEGEVDIGHEYGERAGSEHRAFGERGAEPIALVVRDRPARDRCGLRAVVEDLDAVGVAGDLVVDDLVQHDIRAGARRPRTATVALAPATGEDVRGALGRLGRRGPLDVRAFARGAPAGELVRTRRPGGLQQGLSA